ncbi:MAG: hypothetical protein DI626_08075 [Micavibrio aeruginosavorus]|uniref:BFD-like [2Fe-2S]-binding domain-containing protein n=1 Tax=Micavibrio aeruginosavorus TaxID=349221 RepID=A0A2W5BN49_9BACT|nr:MAG: hypothetical protein DI626_08075 [Micavibrio aeruginosavorus]
MWICHCNPFTDKDVKKALETPDVPNTLACVYKACSGGKNPNCGSCLCAVRDMIVDHQSAIGVQKIKEDLPELAPPQLLAE